MGEVYLVLIDLHTMTKHFVGKVNGDNMSDAVEMIFGVHPQTGSLSIQGTKLGDFQIPANALRIKLSKDSQWVKNYYQVQGNIQIPGAR